MSRRIFVSLPVRNLDAAKAFYTALGFTNEPAFTDETAACMVWTENFFVMVLTHEKWATFTQRPIPPADSSEVMLALGCESRDEVHELAEKAGKNGGTKDVNPPEDHGFMMSRSFTDPDGHLWEAVWMDPTAASDATADEVEASHSGETTPCR